MQDNSPHIDTYHKGLDSLFPSKQSIANDNKSVVESVSDNMQSEVKPSDGFWNEIKNIVAQPGKQLNEGVSKISKGDIAGGTGDILKSGISALGVLFAPISVPASKIGEALPKEIQNLGLPQKTADAINYNISQTASSFAGAIDKLTENLPNSVKNLGVPQDIVDKLNPALRSAGDLATQVLAAKTLDFLKSPEFKLLYEPLKGTKPFQTSTETQGSTNVEKPISTIGGQEKASPSVSKEELSPAFRNLNTGEIVKGNKGELHSDLARSMAEQKTSRPSDTTIKQTVKGMEKGYVNKNGNYMKSGKNGLPMQVESTNSIPDNISKQYKSDWEIPQETNTLKEQNTVTDKIVNAVADVIGNSQTKSLLAVDKMNKLNQYFHFFKDTFKRNPLKLILAQTRDAVDNLAYNRGEQAGNYFKKIMTNKDDRSGLSVLIDSSQLTNNIPSIEALQTELQKIKGTKYESVYQYAINNFDRLNKYTNIVKGVTDSQRARENSFGIETDYTEGYIPRLVYDANDLSNPFPIGGGTGSRYYLKSRDYKTIGDAVANGNDVKTLDIADLLQNRVRNGEMNIEQRQYMSGLKDIKDIDGTPLVRDGVKDKNGTMGAPKGYVPVQMFNRQTIYVNQHYAGIMKSLMADDAVKNSLIGNMALQYEGTLKHSILGLDSFHLSRMAQLGTFLKGSPGFNKGLSVVEYDMSTLDFLHKTGQIDKTTYDYASSVKPQYNELLKGGLNLGKNMENMELGLVRNTPGLKQFNNFTFQKYTRGIMIESALKMLDRNQSLFGDKLSRTEIISKTVKESNTYFANLGRQGIFKNPTWQSLSRIFLLAPNWLESGIRREFMGLKQTAAIPKDLLTTGKLKIGNVAKGIGSLTLGYVAANQIINYVTRGHSTFENPEDGHKFDAWVPGGEQNQGYWISPLSVSYELTHDMLRYTEMGNTPIQAATRIGQNKLSPIGRLTTTEITQHDYRGKKLQGWELQKEALRTQEPTPLAFRGFTTGRDFERQAAASTGIKMSPIYSLGKTKAEMEMMKILNNKGEFYLTQQQRDEYDFIRKYANDIKANRVSKTDEQRAKEMGIYNDEKKTKKLQKLLDNTPGQLAFKRLTAEEATKVWNLMSVKEREKYADIYETKLTNAEGGRIRRRNIRGRR